MPSLPTGTVTFLFTDIEGSTRLLQQLSDRYADVLATHHRLLRTAIQEVQGQVVDTQGDAVFAAFPRARDALLAAVAAQRALLAHPWPDGTAPKVRIGLHTGEPVTGETGYVGMDVHRAARIAAAGHGGQILLSDVTYGLVARDLPDGVSLRDLGEHRLKDLIHPHHLFQVVTADLPADFPRVRSLDVLPNNLPRQLTSFIGREKEMAEVKRLLSTAYLVTLTGAGGAGKTRLAVQVAADVVEGYPNGVWFAELASIADPALVPKTVASALNVPEQPGREMAETLLDALRSKALLLVLDNCEHLLAACRDLAAALLSKCPQVRILATSREALGVPGESLWRVPSLSLPHAGRVPTVEDPVLYEAVRLFVDRATATAPGFTVTTENAVAVAQICQRLDGIPLAIELAAARVRALSIDQIARRLDDRFHLLTGGSRTVPPQHQTLRAAMGWSYDLLTEQERVVWRRLSVFAGGWTLEAAEAVCSGEGLADGELFDLVGHLVDKSLVVFDGQGGDERYRFLETIRQYGRDRLLQSGEAERVQDRHLDFFLKLAEQAEGSLEGAEQAHWLNQLDAEHDNLRVALAWSMRTYGELGLRLAGALRRYWQVHGHFAEGRRWLTLALEKGPQVSLLRGKVLLGAAYIAALQGDYDAARSLAERTLQMYREQGDTHGIATSLHTLGNIASHAGEIDSARSFFEQSLRLYREMGDAPGVATSLGNLGHVVWHQGDLEGARSHLEESLQGCRNIGLRQRLVFALWSLGLVAYDQHDYSEACALYVDGMRVAKELKDVFGVAFVLEALATLSATRGNAERGAQLLGAAEALRESISFPLSRSHRSDYERPVAMIRTVLDDESFSAAWGRGRAMTLEQAIEYALAVEAY